jgi:predicted nucleic acid-binding protein
MNHVAVDTDIFFYSVSTDKKDRKSQLATGLLDHIDNHPALELCVPFSVLAETVFKSLTREKEGSDPHKMEMIASLIELWRKLDIRFLPPTNRVAEICWHLVGECKDRLQPTDRTHLGYALAYNMNYLITTDKILLHYQVPDGFQLKIVSLKDAREMIGLRKDY